MDLSTALAWARNMCEPENANHVSDNEREAIRLLIACGETVLAQALEQATRGDRDV